MPTHHPSLLLRHLRKLATPSDDTVSDRELLHRFAERRDEGAFASLMRRHGPMVLRVCRRVLKHGPDAEDAFQATFLTLARKAGAVRWHDSAAGWLYGVARNTARRARDAAARRAHRERHVPARVSADLLAEMTARELLGALDEELSLLPQEYREPLVLCYLEGATRDEAAQRLGCPLGTLKGRLERGKERLRAALARRGLSLPAALAATLLGRGAADGAVPAPLARATLRGRPDHPGRRGHYDGEAHRRLLRPGSRCRGRGLGGFHNTRRAAEGTRCPERRSAPTTRRPAARRPVWRPAAAWGAGPPRHGAVPARTGPRPRRVLRGRQTPGHRHPEHGGGR
jgi:RNA polymerase sigma factor (sigma-70 family)